MSKIFRILCLDGGGMRGAFSAGVLSAIEEKVLNGKSLTERCDLIAGTSTGAIIALALAFDHRPQEICKFYRESGRKIFPIGNPLAWIFHKIKQLIVAPYSGNVLKREIEKVIGKKKLGEAGHRLVIPCYNAKAGNVFVFKHLFPGDRPAVESQHHKWENYEKCDAYTASEVAVAAAAAPTFFPSRKFADKNFFLDGGIWANSPTLPAIAEAVGALNHAIDEIRVLSIGTRYEKLQIGRAKQRGGFLPWNWKVINLLFNAQAAGAIGTARWLVGWKQFLHLDDQKTEANPKPPIKIDDIARVDDEINLGKEVVEKKLNDIKKFLEPWE
ncbi:MAG: patatin-like phospholipase family protein [Thermodesulfovibrionales bacterium]|nr:patatin-like phospholipase family protein [Thermodesulfovibrionales bacterium]